MMIAEPTVEQFSHNSVGKYVAATRPPFLLAAVTPCLMGLATAFHDGQSVYPVTALLTLIGATVIAAGVNVLNDYYDARNGCDAENVDRLFPYTGGSRFIQNGVLSERETAVFGAALLLSGVIIGLFLLPYAGMGLVTVGLAGLLIGWGYSAPPLALNSRGLGEICVAVCFGSLITVGTDMVQRGGFDPLPLIASAPYGVLVACLLYMNQFPDRRADARAGKRHWVVRLGVRRARWLYVYLAAMAYGMLTLFVAAEWLPPWSLLGLVTLPLSFHAATTLLRYGETPRRLVPAIQATIAAAVIHGLSVSAGLMLA